MQVTKFCNCRGKIVDSRDFTIWFLILTWFDKSRGVMFFSDYSQMTYRAADGSVDEKKRSAKYIL